MINDRTIALAPLFRQANFSAEREFGRLVDAAVRAGQNPLSLRDAFHEFAAVNGYKIRPPEQRTVIFREFLEGMAIPYEAQHLS